MDRIKRYKAGAVTTSKASIIVETFFPVTIFPYEIISDKGTNYICGNIFQNNKQLVLQTQKMYH